MAQNTIGKIPDFTSDETPREVVQEEVKKASVDETVEEEKATPETPAEKPVVNDDDDTKETSVPSKDIQELEKTVNGLQATQTKLLKEIQELRGTRRELKQEQLEKVNKRLDELKDLHPDDVSVVDRILQAKGVVTREEADKMFYDSVKQSKLDEFLDKYPEYKPENDPNDTNWNALQRELGYYKLPTDPHKISEILERSHKMVAKVPSGQSITAQKRQVEVASHGSGGAQRPSPSSKMLDPEKREILKRGGWSEADIKSIESRL